MSKKPLPLIELTLEKIVNGGQAIGVHEDGRKVFVWGGLAGERVRVQITKKKTSLYEGVVVDVLDASPERVGPRDPESYLSTSPWQIMSFDAEQREKAQLIDDSFTLHKVPAPESTTIYSNGDEYGYRNKVEFSFWYDTDANKLDLAFFRRGTHGKIAVSGTSLASPEISQKADQILTVLNQRQVEGRALKTLMLRSTVSGAVGWQLYVKDKAFDGAGLMESFADGENGEVIFSNPLSPASVITKRLTSPTEPLQDELLGTTFYYSVESFFQVNLPVYQKALEDMRAWIGPDDSVLDLYSGVGTIGLTIGGDGVTLVEVNDAAAREMKRNITTLGRSAEAVLSSSEQATDYISSDKLVVVDPPRAGLHEAVVDRLLEVQPRRIIYLSCNPATQLRDIALLLPTYRIAHTQGYNFFPRTPHIEHLVVLDLV